MTDEKEAWHTGNTAHCSSKGRHMDAMRNVMQSSNILSLC